MRVDGKFMVNSDIPEGQGTLNDLLAECYELGQDLRAVVATTETTDSVAKTMAAHSSSEVETELTS